MVRWCGDKAVQHVSIADMYNLALKIAALATKAGENFDDYGVWKFVENQLDDRAANLTEPDVSPLPKFLKRVYAGINRLLRGL